MTEWQFFVLANRVNFWNRGGWPDPIINQVKFRSTRIQLCPTLALFQVHGSCQELAALGTPNGGDLACHMATEMVAFFLFPSFQVITDSWNDTMVRYCMVLFAGIAAEALIYGEAEGGENDENLFRSICVLLQPPLSVAEVSL